MCVCVCVCVCVCECVCVVTFYLQFFPGKLLAFLYIFSSIVTSHELFFLLLFSDIFVDISV